MLSPDEQYARLVAEVRHHITARGRRATRLRWAYEAIQEYAALWGHGEAWCDRLMTELLNEVRPDEAVPARRETARRPA